VLKSGEKQGGGVLSSYKRKGLTHRENGEVG
jgi:hypothetical protein